MPTDVEITPRSDLTSRECRKLAKAMQQFWGFVDRFDVQAVADLRAGELPRPLLLRAVNAAARDPRHANESRAVIIAGLRTQLDDQAASRAFGLEITDEGGERARRNWESGLRSLLKSRLAVEVRVGGVSL